MLGSQSTRTAVAAGLLLAALAVAGCGRLSGHSGAADAGGSPAGHAAASVAAAAPSTVVAASALGSGPASNPATPSPIGPATGPAATAPAPSVPAPAGASDADIAKLLDQIDSLVSGLDGSLDGDGATASQGE